MGCVRNDVIVGIDIGTQSLKAVVTDDALRVCGEASVPYHPCYPHPGWAEQDVATWERALAPAIGRALASAGVAPRSVSGLGLCGQLDGCIATDGAAHALGPCIIWSDRRAQVDIQAIDPARVRDLAGVVLDPTHMAAKIRWLKRHVTASHGIVRFHQPVSYLVARLTGEHVFDHAVASTTMLYSLRRRAFEPELLDAFEIEAGELPAVAEAGACAGRLHAAGAVLSGLPAGTPVAVGTGDDYSTPLGAGLVAPGRVTCTVGTAEVVGALHEAAVIDDSGLLETHGYPDGLFFIENPGWLSGGAVAWLQGVLAVENAATVDLLAATAPAGSAGVLFLPALSGAMTPEWIPDARGCFYGLTAGHGRGHLARAVLEGCAFAMRDVIDRLRAMGVATDAILFLGGGAGSALWSQIRADLTGLPVEVPTVHNASPVGAALLASIAAGIHADIKTAAAQMGRNSTVIKPDSGNLALYEEAHASYHTLFECLRPLYGTTPHGLSR